MSNSFLQKADSNLQQSLIMLDLNGCLELRAWLNGRIRRLRNIPHVKKTIRDLNLSTRAYNALCTNNLLTVEDILRFGTEKIFILRNVGRKTTLEIMNAIEGKSS